MSNTEDGSEPESQEEDQTVISQETVISKTIQEEDITVADVPGEAKSGTESAGIAAIIRDRFVIEERLGKGGQGQIFKARDLRKEEAEDDDPYVAIKFLGEEFSRHPKALISLQREAKKSQQLAHPNILTVYDFDRDGDRVYMTMELLRGAPLSGWEGIAYNEGKAPTEASLIEDIASGLAYAHEFGVIHSDLKPGNVMITTDGRAKILDFGIARIMDSAVEKDSFDAGSLGALTLRYASLEMLRGNNDPHPADDIYALGLMAYQLYAGVHPFAGKTAEEAFQEGLLPKSIKGLKRRRWNAIRNALELKREKRTGSAELFLRQFSGSKNRTRNFLVAIALLAIVIAFLAYRVSLSDGPAIPFEELPPEIQQQFQHNLDLGRKSVDVQDWDGASRYFIAAYDLHPRNPEAEQGLDTLALQLIEIAGGFESQRQREYLLEMIVGFSDNEYMANHPDLSQLRHQLEQELAQ